MCLSVSRSPSKSDRGSPARVKSERRSGSPNPSRASKRSESRSGSRSKSRSRSGRHSNRRQSRSRSRSYSNRRKSHSRSYSPEQRRRRSQSASPGSSSRHQNGSRGQEFPKEASNPGADGDVRANPDPSKCLGVFGLSLYTTERDLKEVFSRHGPLAGVNVVYDQRTGRSRGFAFIYYDRIEDSKEAMERANGMELDGRRIRVDYSITKRPHTPTPGIYMGRPTHNGGGGGSSGGDGRDGGGRDGGGRDGGGRDGRGRDGGGRDGGGRDGRDGGGRDGGGGRRGRDRDSYNDRGYERYDRYEECDYRDSRRRSPSPYYSRYRSRSRSRSYSPRRY
ncbi:transformer-2 protein homolog alpha isoform X2 [Limanda limanda]|uniref:transformer-2 protein homolog alpha isoform X2 n=1 Tax=Limanda limanda TaxID=27771 RepID=UPI0029C670A1|nr:transformer-2 protein homolog alpha isoform X2 [Limanda limanda]